MLMVLAMALALPGNLCRYILGCLLFNALMGIENFIVALAGEHLGDTERHRVFDNWAIVIWLACWGISLPPLPSCRSGSLWMFAGDGRNTITPYINDSCTRSIRDLKITY